MPEKQNMQKIISETNSLSRRNADRLKQSAFLTYGENIVNLDIAKNLKNRGFLLLSQAKTIENILFSLPPRSV